MPRGTTRGKKPTPRAPRKCYCSSCKPTFGDRCRKHGSKIAFIGVVFVAVVVAFIASCHVATGGVNHPHATATPTATSTKAPAVVRTVPAVLPTYTPTATATAVPPVLAPLGDGSASCDAS